MGCLLGVRQYDSREAAAVFAQWLVRQRLAATSRQAWGQPVTRGGSWTLSHSRVGLRSSAALLQVPLTLGLALRRLEVCEQVHGVIQLYS